MVPHRRKPHPDVAIASSNAHRVRTIVAAGAPVGIAPVDERIQARNIAFGGSSVPGRKTTTKAKSGGCQQFRQAGCTAADPMLGRRKMTPNTLLQQSACLLRGRQLPATCGATAAAERHVGSAWEAG